MRCTTNFDLCITRGSKAEHVAILREGFDEVLENPALFRGCLVFRDAQDDTIPDIFKISVVPEKAEDPDRPGEPFVLLEFTIAGSLTAVLPDYDIAAFVELLEVGGDSERLYNLRVRIGD
jgi:hypothetical protein